MKNATVKSSPAYSSHHDGDGDSISNHSALQPDDFSSPALLPWVAPAGHEQDGAGYFLLYWLVSGSPSTSRLLFFCSTLIGTVLAISCAFYRRWMDRFIIASQKCYHYAGDNCHNAFAAFAGPKWLIVMVMIFLEPDNPYLERKAMVIINQDTLQYFIIKGNLFDVGRKMWPYLYPAVATLFIQQCGRAAVYSYLSFLGIGDPALKSWGHAIKAALDYEGILGPYLSLVAVASHFMSDSFYAGPGLAYRF